MLATTITSAPCLDSMLSTSRFLFSQFLLGAMQANLKKGPPTMMASLDHTMWFSNAFHMSDWLLMVVRIHLAYLDRKSIHQQWPCTRFGTHLQQQRCLGCNYGTLWHCLWQIQEGVLRYKASRL